MCFFSACWAFVIFFCILLALLGSEKQQKRINAVNTYGANNDDLQLVRKYYKWHSIYLIGIIFLLFGLFILLSLVSFESTESYANEKERGDYNTGTERTVIGQIAEKGYDPLYLENYYVLDLSP